MKDCANEWPLNGTFSDAVPAILQGNELVLGWNKTASAVGPHLVRKAIHSFNREGKRAAFATDDLIFRSALNQGRRQDYRPSNLPAGDPTFGGKLRIES